MPVRNRTAPLERGPPAIAKEPHARSASFLRVPRPPHQEQTTNNTFFRTPNGARSAPVPPTNAQNTVAIAYMWASPRSSGPPVPFAHTEASAARAAKWPACAGAAAARAGSQAASPLTASHECTTFACGLHSASLAGLINASVRWCSCCGRGVPCCAAGRQTRGRSCGGSLGCSRLSPKACRQCACSRCAAHDAPGAQCTPVS